MEKVTVILILTESIVKLAVGLQLTVTRSECGSYYDMEDIGEDAYLIYRGERLNNAECSVEFTNYQTHEKQTCITPEKINLGCSTTVEYFRNFMLEFRHPVRKFTCVEKSLKEWCGPTRTNRVYIVFRTSGKSPSSYIRLHIYLKKLPGSTDSDSDSYSPSSSFGPIVGAFVGSAVVVFILMGCIVACKVAQHRRHAMPRTPYTVVQASVAPENVSSNQPLQQPVYQPPRQALFQAGLQGYQLHPLQSVQPVSTEQRYNIGTGYQPGPQEETGRNSFGSLYRPTAPPLDNADPPPSYESVLK